MSFCSINRNSRLETIYYANKVNVIVSNKIVQSLIVCINITNNNCASSYCRTKINQQRYTS